jgi:hypothetical protein
MTLEEDRLRADPALRGRCERGIARLLERAVRAHEDGSVEVWVTRTRAMIIRDAHVLTLLVAPTSRGFGKRFLRQANAGHREAAAFLLSPSEACRPVSHPQHGSR